MASSGLLKSLNVNRLQRNRLEVNRLRVREQELQELQELPEEKIYYSLLCQITLIDDYMTLKYDDLTSLIKYTERPNLVSETYKSKEEINSELDHVFNLDDSNNSFNENPPNIIISNLKEQVSYTMPSREDITKDLNTMTVSLRLTRLNTVLTGEMERSPGLMLNEKTNVTIYIDSALDADQRTIQFISSKIFQSYGNAGPVPPLKTKPGWYRNPNRGLGWSWLNEKGGYGSKVRPTELLGPWWIKDLIPIINDLLQGPRGDTNWALWEAIDSYNNYDGPNYDGRDGPGVNGPIQSVIVNGAVMIQKRYEYYSFTLDPIEKSPWGWRMVEHQSSGYTYTWDYVHGFTLRANEAERQRIIRLESIKNMQNKLKNTPDEKLKSLGAPDWLIVISNNLSRIDYNSITLRGPFDNEHNEWWTTLKILMTEFNDDNKLDNKKLLESLVKYPIIITNLDEQKTYFMTDYIKRMNGVQVLEYLNGAIEIQSFSKNIKLTFDNIGVVSIEELPYRIVTIEYGTINRKIDVTNIFKNINIIPAGDAEKYKIIEIDPAVGIVKHIFINEVDYGPGEIDLSNFVWT